MLSRLRRTPFWCWWIVFVWIVSFPWLGRAKTPQWQRVHWVPFKDPADKWRDVVANVALFVPFGFSFAGSGRRASTLRICLVAAAVSVSGEALQLYSTNRYPSATDVTCAVFGAAAGRALRVRQGMLANPNL